MTKHATGAGELFASGAEGEGRPSADFPVCGGCSAAPRAEDEPRSDGRRSKCGYEIRLASTPEQREAADCLLRRMYAWRGYCLPPSPPDADQQANRAVLSAWLGGQVVATLTLRRDSPDGLCADALYAGEMASIRGPGRVVCEVTRLAIHPSFSSAGVLNALFAAAFGHAREQLAASDAVIEVNPRHVRYYQSRLGFRALGATLLCPRVNAPAVLMHQYIETLNRMGVFAEETDAAWVRSA